MSNNVSAKIIIATHKQYHFPSDSIYLPLHVGKVDKKDLGLNGDDTGDNISAKNASYCELTGLYWAWKTYRKIILGSCIIGGIFRILKRIQKINSKIFYPKLN